MSVLTYTLVVRKADKPLLWLHGEIKTPQPVIKICKKRLRNYLAVAADKETKR